jgi:uncharacterized protein (TIGR02302 family)
VEQKQAAKTSGLRAMLAARAGHRLTRLIWLTRASLLVERLARALAPAAIVTGFFIALSWTGLWLGAHHLARAAGSLIYALLLLAALWPLRRLSWPTDAQARDALDAGRPDAPAAALHDALANEADPQTQALWRLHQKRALKNASDLRTPAPAPNLWRLDPIALGALAVLALCAGGFVAGPEKYARVAAAFDWRWNAAAGPTARIDAWIDPPAYTGRPPVVLPLNGAADKAAKPVEAPFGSIIVVRAADAGDLRITTKGGLEVASQAPEPRAKTLAAKGGVTESRFILRGDGRLALSRGGSSLADLALRSLPDLPPTIELIGKPIRNARGTFTLSYKITDDYGARDAEVKAAPAAGQQASGHALVAPPTAKLDLPGAPGRLGEGRTTIDWTDSPYAGATVNLTLSVQDEGGNQGDAVLANFVLPQKTFNNPLARALAEQRRNLALDSDQKDSTLAAIDALMIAPASFTPQLGVYLGLRFVHASLRHARTDDDLRAAADVLWEMALRLEEGDAPQAERDLRAAQKALREALEKGAPPEEIAKLTEQLQKAMDAFLAALEKQQAGQRQNGDSEVGEGKSISARDLKAMLDQLAEAARNGDKDAAKALLDRMQDMLENLRAAQQSPGSSKAAQDRKTMREIDKMMREQQKLRDETFAHERGDQQEETGAAQPPEASSPIPGPGKGKGSSKGHEREQKAEQGGLGGRQQQLRERLDELQKQAAKPGSAGPKGLDDAEKAMRQAEQALAQGDDASAVEAQGRALDGLRKGAGEMAKQAQQNGPGEKNAGEDESEPGQEGRQSRGQNGEGPFGRADHQQKVDATSAQRARKVLEELRRRLADPNRASDEIDYLERLIKPD